MFIAFSLIFQKTHDRILGLGGGLSHLSYSVATSRRRFGRIIWNEPIIPVILHRGKEKSHREDLRFIRYNNKLDLFFLFHSAFRFLVSN